MIVSYETTRRWCAEFGQIYANELRRNQPRPGDKWHLDEAFVKINGEQKYLWRAVDADGNVLDILLQDRRNNAAARRFFRALLKKICSVPRVVWSPTGSVPTPRPTARRRPPPSTVPTRV